ncbi:MAG: TonB family protein [Erythrobacter sp.]|uniref:TonB family protein n=1 Tax=Erythrobacter sp. TaxID=1042 RepID=UPI001B144376|nr:TonB family protein [Erythrobacter sp.]MBO6768062.1 TonB family protein [Erythrobacter sp.]
MSYVDQSRGPSPAGIAAVIGVHAAVAALLVTGLTVTGVIPEVRTDWEVRDIPDTPPPPPPEPPADPVEAKPAQPTEPLVHVPQPKFELDTTAPTIPSTELIFPPLPTPSPGLGTAVPTPAPQPSFTPVGAKPRNDPAAWFSDNDYRPAWIRKELTGLATFRLAIAANGRVTGCTVTASTGHGELDAATCRLVSKRARFEPARGGTGEAVAGSYTGSVLWRLPD